MACSATCYQIEYRAQPVKVLSSTPNPDKNPCNNNVNKAYAEQQAKGELDAQMSLKRENVDNCGRENGCKCPDWPQWAGGWALDVKGLTSVHKINVPNVPGGCAWTIVLQYNREKRERSQSCVPA